MTSPALWPLGAPLGLDVMKARLDVWPERLHCIRAMREPRGTGPHLLVKDNIGLSGFTTTAGSWALRNLVLGDAFCVKRLKAAGFDLFGKTNLSELAGFVSTRAPGGYSEVGGWEVNPHGDFPAGGSSTGSAIAVAAGLCDAALGTETRGSLMLPALHCGVCAVKPSVGLVSRTGIVPLAPTFDTAGVLARDMATLGRTLTAMRGFDPEDAFTILSESIDLSERDFSSPIRIGVLRGREADPEKSALLDEIRKRLGSEGFEFEDVPAPEQDFAYETISSIDFRESLTDFLTKNAGVGSPKTFAELAALYEARPESRPYGMDRLEKALRMEKPTDYPALVNETIFSARNLVDGLLEGGEFDALLSTAYLDWWAIGGMPSLAVPAGVRASGEPFGFMIGAAFGADGLLLSVGERIEKALG